MGAFLVAYGTLLTSKSSVFLRFHDAFVDRSRWNRNAEWRRNVDRLEFKILGVIFLLFGLFVVFISVTRLLQEI